MHPTDLMMIFGIALAALGGLTGAACGIVGLTAVAGIGALTLLAGLVLMALGSLLGMLAHPEK